MSRCANTEALNAYMREIDKKEIAYECLQRDIQDNLDVISEQVEIIKDEFKNYGIDYDKEFIYDAIY